MCSGNVTFRCLVCGFKVTGTTFYSECSYCGAKNQYIEHISVPVLEIPEACLTGVQRDHQGNEDVCQHPLQ